MTRQSLIHYALRSTFSEEHIIKWNVTNYASISHYNTQDNFGLNTNNLQTVNVAAMLKG